MTIDIIDNEGLSVGHIETMSDGVLHDVSSVQSINSAALSPKTIDISSPDGIEKVSNLGNPFGLSDEEMTSKLQDMQEHPQTILDAAVQMDLSKLIPFYGAGEDIYDSTNFLSLATKERNNQSLTEDEKNSLSNYKRNAIRQNFEEKKISTQIFEGVVNMPRYIVEFGSMLALGTGTGAVASRAGASAIGKAAATIAGASVVAVPTVYAPKYAERRLNDSVAITDKGEMLYQASQESKVKSAVMAGLYGTSQIGSELVGGKIVEGITKPLRTPIINGFSKLSPDLQIKISNAISAVIPDASISEMMSKVGWHGVVGEFAENRVQQASDAVIGFLEKDPQSFDEFVNKAFPSNEQLFVEAGILSIFGGISTSAFVAKKMLMQKGKTPEEAQEIIDNHSATELDKFVEENLQYPETPYSYLHEYPELSIEDFDKIHTQKYIDEAAKIKDDLLGYVEPIKQLNYRPISLSQFIKRTGGIEDYSGELANRGINNKSLVGLVRKSKAKQVEQGNLITNENSAVGIDAVKERVFDAGYFPQYQDYNEITDSELYDAIAQDLFSDKIYNNQTNNDLIALSGDRETLINDYEKEGISADMSIEDIAKRLQEIDISISEEPQIDKEPLYDMIDNLPETKITNDFIASQPPMIVHKEESNFMNAYRRVVNQKQPIDDLTNGLRDAGILLEDAANPKYLASLIAGINGKIKTYIAYKPFIYDDTGNIKFQGKSLANIINDFDNILQPLEKSRDIRQNDFNNFLLALRYIDLANNREEITVTDKQKEKSLSDMFMLNKKYGEHIKHFNEFAKQLYKFQSDALHLLVQAGNMSQEQYDDIIRKNPFYIPLKRILPDDKKVVNGISNKILSNARITKVVKRLKGSDKEVKNIFESIMSNTAKIINLAETNKVVASVVNLKEQFPQIQQVQRAIVKKGETKTLVAFDKGLRDKLEETIDALGGSLDRVKSLRVKNNGVVLGVYNPLENRIKVRIGSTEGTLTHELGHLIDEKFGIGNFLLTDKKISDELIELGKKRLADGAEADPKYIDYITNKEEIIANFFDAYINSPKLAQQIAPNAVAKFSELINKNSELSFIKEIKPSVVRGTEEITMSLYGKSDYLPPQTIVYFRNGVEEIYQVPKALYEAMNSLHPAQLSFIDKILGLSATTLRVGATLTPDFAIRNALRDAQVGLIQTHGKFRPNDFAKGMFAILSKSDLYHEWKASGASFDSYMDLSDKGLGNLYKELINKDGVILHYIKHPLKFFEDFSQLLEQSSRVGVYNKYKQLGATSIEAGYKSRNATLDFARKGGAGMQRANRLIPFLNAGIQSIDRMVSTFKTHPRATCLIGLSTITAPSVMIAGYYMFAAPEDEKKEYQEIPRWQKDLFWVVKINGEWVRYPKPFAYGYIFGSIPERIMEFATNKSYNDAKDQWLDIAKGVANAFSPVSDISSLLPPLIKVYAEGVSNYNFFTDREIYSSYLDKDLPENRYNYKTTETAKILGKELDMSPAIIDNTMRGLFGGSADYATGATDRIISTVREWNNIENISKPKTLSDMLFIKGFLVAEPAGYKSESVATFTKKFKKLEQYNNAYKDLTGDARIKFKEENEEKLTKYKLMKKTNDDIRNINKQVRKIREDKAMTSSDKTAAISELNKEMTNKAREALKSGK